MIICEVFFAREAVGRPFKQGRPKDGRERDEDACGELGKVSREFVCETSTDSLT